MAWCGNCRIEGEEFLTEHEDGLIKPYWACPNCSKFQDWEKIEKSQLVKKILKQNLEQYKRKIV